MQINAAQEIVHNPLLQLNSIFEHKPDKPSAHFYAHVLTAITQIQKHNPAQYTDAIKYIHDLYTKRKNIIERIHTLNKDYCSQEAINGCINLLLTIKKSYQPEDTYHQYFESKLIDAYQHKAQLQLSSRSPHHESIKKTITTLLTYPLSPTIRTQWEKTLRKVNVSIQISKAIESIECSPNQTLEQVHTLKYLYTQLSSLYNHYHPIRNNIQTTINALNHSITIKILEDHFKQIQKTTGPQYAPLAATLYFIHSDNHQNTLLQYDMDKYHYLAMLEYVTSIPVSKNINNPAVRETLLRSINSMHLIQSLSRYTDSTYETTMQAIEKQKSYIERLTTVIDRTDINLESDFIYLLGAIECTKALFPIESPTAQSLIDHKQHIVEIRTQITALKKRAALLQVMAPITYDTAQAICILEKDSSDLINKCSFSSSTQYSINAIMGPLDKQYNAIQLKKETLKELLTKTATRQSPTISHVS